MSNVSRRMQQHVLAVALATALTAGVAVSASAAGRVDLGGLQSSEQSSFDRFIVKYRDGSSAALKSSLDNAAAAQPKKNGQALAVGHLRKLAIGADVVKANRKLDRVEAEALMRQIAADPSVEYVEVDRIMRPVLTPNDTHYGTYLWGLQDGVGGMKANQAWDASTGAGVVVAVLDTGITTHSDLGANILPGYDFISDTFVSRDGNGRDSNPQDEGDWNPVRGECYTNSPIGDSSWHGTHVAGTIAAVGNNAKGVIGAAYDAKVVPVRVLGRCGGLTSDITDAIVWASGGTVSGVPTNANPAEVINLSLGGGGSCSATYQNAINSAVGRGTTVVVAAGNDNADASGYTPASCGNVINVAATNKNGGRASYSNYGSSIDVAAPGGDSPDCSTLIVSTGNSGTTTPGTENYLCMAGTSMASPHVAGVVALMQSVATAPLTPAQVESTLKSTLRAFPASTDRPIGAGIVDAAAAVAAVTGGGTDPDPVGQTYTNSTDYNIPDNNRTGITSTINVSGRSGNASGTTQVAVSIAHTYIGDLVVDLLAPDGTVYNLHNRTGGSADGIDTTYTVNLSGEALNGAWKLRAVDRGRRDTGNINSWSITF